MTHSEFQDKRYKLNYKIDDAKKELLKFEYEYANEVLKNIGFSVGDSVEDSGIKGVIIDVHMTGIYPVVRVTNVRKNGEMALTHNQYLSDLLTQRCREYLNKNDTVVTSINR